MKKKFREHLFSQNNNWKSFPNIYFCESKEIIQDFKDMFAMFAIETYRMTENKIVVKRNSSCYKVSS